MRVAVNAGNKRNWLIACSIFSCIVLVLSFLTQYVWKIEPCRLCKLQRLPYFLLMFVPLLRNIKYHILQVVILSLFLVSALLAAYHLLVIGGFVKDLCAVPSQIGTIDNFMEMLDAHVPCSKAEWRVLGVPVAGYNLLISMVFIWVFAFHKPRYIEVIDEHFLINRKTS